MDESQIAIVQQVQTRLGELGMSIQDLAHTLHIPALFLSNFMRGSRLPEQHVGSLQTWLNGESTAEAPETPPETSTEIPPEQGSPPIGYEMVCGSPQAMDFVRQLCAGQPFVLDTFLEAFMERSVMGQPETLERLHAACPNATGERLTLEDLERRFFDLREGHERALLRLTQAAAKPSVAHSPDDCAQTILSMAPPQVIEQMEVAMQVQARSPAEIIAGLLVVFRNELIRGPDFTEVRAPTVGPVLGQQLWSPVQQTHRPGTPATGSVCEVCQQPFTPRPDQYRPRFGCNVCGAVEPLWQQNMREVRRSAEVEDRYATIKPSTMREQWISLGHPSTWPAGYQDPAHPYWQSWREAAMESLQFDMRMHCTCGPATSQVA